MSVYIIIKRDKFLDLWYSVRSTSENEKETSSINFDICNIDANVYLDNLVKIIHKSKFVGTQYKKYLIKHIVCFILFNNTLI